MNVVEVTFKRAYDIWWAFGQAIGMDNLRAFYGKNWPRIPVDGERIWLFLEGEKRVGWASLRPDPVEPFVWQNLGVWPEFQSKGLMKEVQRFLLRMAFKEMKAEAILIAISRNNQSLLNSRQKYLEIAGYIDFPEPGYVYFIIRRDYGKGTSSLTV